MDINLSELSANRIYHLMTQTVIPRPIAWVLSENQDNNFNLAPFSYFNAVCSDPPLCILSMGKKPNGSAKDTVTNLHHDAHCVVHIAHAQQADTVTATAATLEYGHSEVEENNISLVKHGDWRLPRVEACPVAYYCKVHDRQTIGNNQQQIIFVEALELYIDDQAVSQDDGRLKIDALEINPLARLGANQYADLGKVFSRHRPK